MTINIDINWWLRSFHLIHTYINERISKCQNECIMNRKISWNLLEKWVRARILMFTRTRAPFHNKKIYYLQFLWILHILLWNRVHYIQRNLDGGPSRERVHGNKRHLCENFIFVFFDFTILLITKFAQHIFWILKMHCIKNTFG